MVLLSVIVTLVLLFPTSAFRTGNWLPDIGRGIDDPGGAYALSEDLRDNGNPFIEYVRFFFGPLLFLSMPLSVFYWRKLGFRVRILAVFSILGVVALFVAMGTNRGIADTVLLVPWLLTAAHFSGMIRFTAKRIIFITAC